MSQWWSWEQELVPSPPSSPGTASPSPFPSLADNDPGLTLPQDFLPAQRFPSQALGGRCETCTPGSSHRGKPPRVALGVGKRGGVSRESHGRERSAMPFAGAGNPPLSPEAGGGSMEHLSSPRLCPPQVCLRRRVQAGGPTPVGTSPRETLHTGLFAASETRAAASSASPQGGRVRTGPCGAHQGPSCGCRQPRPTKGSVHPSCGSKPTAPPWPRPQPLQVLQGSGRCAAPAPPGLEVLGWLRLGQGGGMSSCHFGLPCAGGVCSAPRPPAAQIHTRHHLAVFLVLQDRQSPSVSQCTQETHGHDLPEGPPPPQPSALGGMRMQKSCQSPSPSPPQLGHLQPPNLSKAAHPGLGTAAACGSAGPGDPQGGCLQPHQSPASLGLNFLERQSAKCPVK